jgi:hypothetical protein
MMSLAWKLSEDGEAVDVFDFHPTTRQLTLRRRFNFKKKMTAEDARKFVEANYPADTADVRIAADSLGRFLHKR